MSVNANDPWLPADPVPYARPATPITVYRVSSTNTLELMSSLRCLWIEEREGPTPATALFRYAFDGIDPNSPQTVEEALSTTSLLPKLVEIGDRLAVAATDTDGNPTWIFDGIPMTWSMQLNGAVEMVTISCVSRFFREWDTPIGGALMRQSATPETVADIPTDIVSQFNPRGLPNATPSTGDAGTIPNMYPTFMDPNRKGTDAKGKAYPRSWMLPMAVAHLLYTNNATGKPVANPTRDDLDNLLISYEPIPGVPWDPNNSASYNADDIQAADAPLTGRSWPATVHDLIKDYGFGMRVDLSTLTDGSPGQTLALFLKQGGDIKVIYLQSRGSNLDPAWTNVGEAAMGRDLASVVNQFVVRGAPLRYEFTGVLIPQFPSASADSASDSAIMAYSTNEADPTAIIGDTYRVWAFGEGGDTYYDNASTTPITGLATSLDAVLGAPVSGVAQYVQRRRKPIGKLITTDDSGVPLDAVLEIGTGTDPGYPATGLGTLVTNWQIVQGGWTLLKDRIGIRITIDNPEKWYIGPALTGAYPDGIVRVVSAIGNPTTDNPAFHLRLTCVIEGDLALNATAKLQSTSPLTYPVTREIDARDRLFLNTIAGLSRFNTPTAASVERDDTKLATAEAVAARIAADSGVFSGDVTIPRFTAFYGIGDRISGITGRNLGFRTDSGGTSYAPVYPVVMARRWDFDGGQTTSLELSDAGLDRRQYSRKKPDGYGKTRDADFWKGVAARASEIQQAGLGVALKING